jgi:beta-phosphoglucomutase-like phosphatase (HAD superfamily)
MNTIIFDMDGILVDTMPFHYEAMKRAVKEFTDIELDKRTFYLLEGMPITEMAQKILELKGYDTKQTENTEFDIVAQKIGTRKKQIFLEMKQIPESFNGVRELLHDSLEGCLKAVVTGSSKQELDTIIEHNFGTDASVSLWCEQIFFCKCFTMRAFVFIIPGSNGTLGLKKRQKIK